MLSVFARKATPPGAALSLLCALAAAASLHPSEASAQTYCGTPASSYIISSRCVVENSGQTGGNVTPCKLTSGAPMPANERTVEVSFCSKALGRVASARVVLPRNYYSAGNPPAPTLYLLHGANNDANLVYENNYRDWTNNTDVEEVVTASTNTFVVTPTGGPIGWYSDWRGTPTAIINWQPKGFPQKWETHFFDELIPLLDAKFPNSGQRVIAGLSMGGMGAISFAARAPLHNRSFRAAASFSGGLSTRANYAVMEGQLAAKLQQPFLIWGHPNDPTSDWAAHDPRALVDQLVNLPVWVHARNGAGADVVEIGAWSMSTDYANAQDAALSRARYNAAANGVAGPKGYVVRDMGRVDPGTGINPGCLGNHDWNNWREAIKRAWPFLKSHLTATGSTIPPAPAVPVCGVLPTAF